MAISTPRLFNPFQPNRIVMPGMFTGRVAELQIIEQCLLQAANGNPQHFLIQGERGIGKSSLLLYIDIVAQGDLPLIISPNKTRFITASIDLGGCNTQVDIIRALGRGIRKAAGQHQVIKEKAAQAWDWLLNWEVLGVRFHKDNPDVDPQDIADELVEKIGSLYNQVSDEFDGALILIDEADQPPVDANLGAFLKFFTERLTRSGHNSVLIGMAGLPTLLTKLRNSHESAPRLFETLHLDPLEFDERRQVVLTGLAEANRKNPYEITADKRGLDFIATLSEGYPHFVQQFAYSAFEENDDEAITIDDVLRGAFKENGAIAQLGRKYFDEMYYGKIGSDDYRRVLNTMAEESDGWISRKEIIERSDVRDSTVNNALTAMKARNIIIADEGRQGYYRLPTKSFAAWINAIKSIEGTGGDRLPLFEE